MKTKQGLLQAVDEEIRRLQALADQIESSDEPDFRSLSELSDVMKQRREALSLSAGEVGDLCGVSANTVLAIEKGTGNPTIRTLQGVGKVLNFQLWIELK